MPCHGLETCISTMRIVSVILSARKVMMTIFWDPEECACWLTTTTTKKTDNFNIQSWNVLITEQRIHRVISDVCSTLHTACSNRQIELPWTDAVQLTSCTILHQCTSAIHHTEYLYNTQISTKKYIQSSCCCCRCCHDKPVRHCLYGETKMSRRDEEFHQTLNLDGSVSPSW